jgi:hypothetical protein
MYYGKEDSLLKTIKFNPYNLNSIKLNLPKSSYGREDENKNNSKSRNASIDSLDNLKRDRALSACGVRNPLNQCKIIF